MQVVWQTDTSAEAVKARAEEQLSAAMSSMVTVGNTEAEEAEARKREEKRKAKEEAARLVRPPAHALTISHPVGSFLLSKRRAACSRTRLLALRPSACGPFSAKNCHCVLAGAHRVTLKVKGCAG